MGGIKPGIPETAFEGPKSSENAAYVDAVARTNVKLGIESIRRRSPVLEDLERRGSIQISGAMYNLVNGVVEFVGSRGQTKHFKCPIGVLTRSSETLCLVLAT